MEKEQKEKIILKSEYTKPREVSVGDHVLRALPGKPVEVPLSQLQMWLNTGRFDWIQPEADDSDLPKELPGRAALKAAKPPIDLSKLVTMDRAALIAVPGIAEKTADAILEFLAKPKGGNS